MSYIFCVLDSRTFLPKLMVFSSPEMVGNFYLLAGFDQKYIKVNVGAYCTDQKRRFLGQLCDFAYKGDETANVTDKNMSNEAKQILPYCSKENHQIFCKNYDNLKTLHNSKNLICPKVRTRFTYYISKPQTELQFSFFFEIISYIY